MRAELRETMLDDNAFNCEFCGSNRGYSCAIYMPFEFAHRTLRILYMACGPCNEKIREQLKSWNLLIS